MSLKIKLDPKNFNRHTETGMQLLEKSISEVGAIESIAIDKKGEIITGNARFETFEKLGYKPKIIKLGENEYPVIQTELDGERRVKAAILANTTAQRNIEFDNNIIKEIAIDEYNIEVKDYGIEFLLEETQESPKTIKTTPYSMTHVLLSFPPEKLMQIQELLERIKEFEFVEYEQSSN